jgi:hypothetical protein
MRAPDPGPPEPLGVTHFRVRSKRGKIRFVQVHAMAQRLIEYYVVLSRPRGRCRRPCVFVQ